MPNSNAGIKGFASWRIRLLPELSAHLNPMSFDAATQMEIYLAEDLRRVGYTVTGGH
jgi:hypothetical protein